MPTVCDLGCASQRPELRVSGVWRLAGNLDGVHHRAMKSRFRCTAVRSFSVVLVSLSLVFFCLQSETVGQAVQKKAEGVEAQKAAGAGAPPSVERSASEMENEPAVRYFSDDQVLVGSAAVRVRRGYLVHSGSVSPRKATGNVADDFALAVDELDKYEPTRNFPGGGLSRTLVKLHVCIAPEAGMAADLIPAVQKRWPQGDAPAMTVVSASGAEDLTIDAVWHVEPAVPALATEEWMSAFEERYPATSGVLSPRRDIIHVSGRAAAGELGEATRETMNELFAVLRGLGAGPENVVQVKAFIRPISGIDDVEQQISESFGGGEIPPIVFVEWTSPSRSTEIELIASAPEHSDVGDSVSYYTPPGDKSSPVYSRAGRIHGQHVIYIGGFAATEGGFGEREVKTIYAGLKRISGMSGTDLKHFAKATYYVSGEDASLALNTLRPHYYDPKRPPAASKVMVPGIAIKNRTLLIDMVAAGVPME